MANQGPDRRTILEMLTKASIASQFTGFQRWAFGQQHHAGDDHAAHSVQPYRPTFFNPAEYRDIEILTDLIIPADETPGAKEAGASEFIDFLAANGETEIQQPMRDGLKWLNRTAAENHGAAFDRLSAEQQNGILKRIAYGGPKVTGDEEGRAFFRLIRRYTVMGFYTSRVGLKELDFPGLRLYSQSPACPHTDDPGHLHLAKAGA